MTPLIRSILTSSVLFFTTAPSWGQPSYNPTLSAIGSGNTAGGTAALLFDKGLNNTAFGRLALGGNKGGNANTAMGASALQANGSGQRNIAVGNAALRFNQTGSGNTALGHAALRANTTGGGNIAIGVDALHVNTSGGVNTAIGGAALFAHVTGQENIGIGTQALRTVTTGNFNLALGEYAGFNLLTGNNNIYLGNRADAVIESDTLRLGQDQTRAFIAGVVGVPVVGAPVVITPYGQLGVGAAVTSAVPGPDPLVTKLQAQLAAQQQQITYLTARLVELETAMRTAASQTVKIGGAQ